MDFTEIKFTKDKLAMNATVSELMQTCRSLKMCIEILEGIMYFEQRKKHRIESIEGFAGTFPELRRKYVNDIDTINRCIKRLEQRYKSVLESLNI